MEANVIVAQKKVNYNFPERGIDLYERVLNETMQRLKRMKLRLYIELVLLMMSIDTISQLLMRRTKLKKVGLIKIGKKNEILSNT